MPDSPHTADIVERLNTMFSHRGDGIPTQFVNPDGPKAAAEIKALRADNAELARVTKEQTEVIAELEDELRAKAGLP